MKKLPTKINGAWLLKPEVHGDARGFFVETWNREVFREVGLDADFVQDNHIRSPKGVLRGLHYQTGNAAQAKLIWISSGSVFDVIVDLRRSSPTYGEWDSYILSADKLTQLYVPAGCAHGFLVLSDHCDFHYKVSRLHDPVAERALLWNDPTLAINWPLASGAEPLLSERDLNAPGFAACEKYP